MGVYKRLYPQTTVNYARLINDPKSIYIKYTLQRIYFYTSYIDTGYSVQYKISNAPDSAYRTPDRQPSPTANEAIIEGLTPGEEYTIKLVATFGE